MDACMSTPRRQIPGLGAGKDGQRRDDAEAGAHDLRDADEEGEVEGGEQNHHGE